MLRVNPMMSASGQLAAEQNEPQNRPQFAGFALSETIL
jgi:hypothetical protein